MIYEVVVNYYHEVFQFCSIAYDVDVLFLDMSSQVIMSFVAVDDVKRNKMKTLETPSKNLPSLLLCFKKFSGEEQKKYV